MLWLLVLVSMIVGLLVVLIIYVNCWLLGESCMVWMVCILFSLVSRWLMCGLIGVVLVYMVGVSVLVSIVSGR